MCEMMASSAEAASIFVANTESANKIEAVRAFIACGLTILLHAVEREGGSSSPLLDAKNNAPLAPQLTSPPKAFGADPPSSHLPSGVVISVPGGGVNSNVDGGIGPVTWFEYVVTMRSPFGCNISVRCARDSALI